MEQPGRSLLKIKCTQFIKSQYEIYYNNERVIITTNEGYNDLLEIQFKNVNFNNSDISLSFEFISKFEGV